MRVIAGNYQSSIVVISIIISLMGSYITLDINERALFSFNRSKWFWIFLGAISMGITIWSMHFIGMLSFSLPLPIHYHFAKTIISIIPAIITAFIAFFTFHFLKYTPVTLTITGIIMGAGIVFMHYSGMAAITYPVTIQYSWQYVSLSILISIIISYAALYIFHLVQKKRSLLFKLFSSIILGLAISCMHYTGMKAASFCIPKTIQLGSGLYRSQSLLLYTVIGTTSIIFLIFLGTLIIERKFANYLTFYDELTGLPNRRSMEQQISSDNGQHPSVLILIDLDNFQWINNSFGFETGNLLIQKVAQKLQSFTPFKNAVGRLEGNQFVLHCTHIDTYDEIEAFIISLQNELRIPYYIENNPILLTYSIGISREPEDGDTAKKLLQSAEYALQYVKAMGKNHYVFYETITSEADTEREIGVKFRTALDEKEFYLCYQPKYSPFEKRISSFEALIRWENKELGQISPSIFIPIAEKNGFIFDLTAFVLQEACKQIKQWMENGLPIKKIAVNISSHHFLANNLVQLVSNTLDKYDLDGQHLELEITETSIMENISKAKETMMELKKMGISIALDDFGTGISSLTHLKNLPIDVLKIDKSFIDDIALSQKDTSLVKMIIELGKLFELKVVAEGVETKEQLKLLKELNCDEIQGYFISKPLKSAEISAFLKDYTHIS